jgi:pyruvate dehydrogenase E2 component (dihydrolipoamide acetyltransferase)
LSVAIHSLVMPKWGLTMSEGTIVSWLVDEGEEVAAGDELVEVETDKMTAAVEAQDAGVVRRRVAGEGDVVTVGGMLAVLAAPEVSDDEIQAFIDAAPKPEAVAAKAVDLGPASETIAGTLGPIHLLVRGDAPDVVVLIHGFGGDALNWRFTIDALAERFTVLAPDLPGHGASTKNVGGATPDELVESVVEVLDAKGVARAHVVGHSLGGLVAARLAAREPARVASLSLIAPAGLGDAINAEFIDGFVAASSRREVKAVLRTLFADESIVNRQLVEEVLRYKRLDGVPEALGALRDTLFPAGVQAVAINADLADVQVPVLVLWGAQDAVIASEQAADAPTGARVEIVDGAGHSPHVEAAAEVNSRLTTFLESR